MDERLELQKTINYIKVVSVLIGDEYTFLPKLVTLKVLSYDEFNNKIVHVRPGMHLDIYIYIIILTTIKPIFSLFRFFLFIFFFKNTHTHTHIQFNLKFTYLHFFFVYLKYYYEKNKFDAITIFVDAAHRLEKQIYSKTGILCPDVSYLPDTMHLKGGNNQKQVADVYSIEIKPKQGWIFGEQLGQQKQVHLKHGLTLNYTDKCRYCCMQYLKVVFNLITFTVLFTKYVHFFFCRRRKSLLID